MHFAKKIALFFLACLQTCSAVFGNEDHLSTDVNQIAPGSAIGVSLGSWCESAEMIGAVGLQKAYFPFDWIVSEDIEKIIELLNNDFLHVLHDDFLKPIEMPDGRHPLVNTYYHLEFIHEGEYANNSFLDVLKNQHQFEVFKAKYQRRFERFKNLTNYRGKVYFVRSADPHSMSHNARLYRISENLEISDDAALKLYEALKRRFPNLNFTLVIFNNHKTHSVEFEKKLLDNLVMMRVNPSMDVWQRRASYNSFFKQLMKEDGF